MLPTEAILDATLVKSVPASVTADTGMDVLTHAIEAYVSINNNEFSAALAEKAIEICGTFLLRSYLDNTDSHARKKMHVASCLAGLAFNSASLGLNHGIAHAIGARFHIPHGRANAIVLPHIIEFNSGINKHSKSRSDYPKCVEKYCNVAKLLGVNNFNEITTIHALTGWVNFMNKEMNIPLSISQCGIDKNEYMNAVEQMAEKALADACTATNPRVPSKSDVCLILEHLYYE
jgi:alcohol dehydrogenase class IV